MSTARRAYDLLRSYVNNEWDRVQGLARADALAELDAPATGTAPAESAPTIQPENPRALACQVLGVEESAHFDEVRHAFERLSRRSDPTRFPEGSDEQRRAIDLQRRVHWAYNELTRDVPTTEKRFRSLEIE